MLNIMLYVCEAIILVYIEMDYTRIWQGRVSVTLHESNAVS